MCGRWENSVEIPALYPLSGTLGTAYYSKAEEIVSINFLRLMENLLYKRKSILTTFKFLFLGELLRHHSVSSFMHVVRGLPPSRKSCAFKVDSSQILDT